jgi:hypothetical protein
MRIRTILAAAAAPAALAAVLLGTSGTAHAAVLSGTDPTTITVSSQEQADALPGTITKNIDVTGTRPTPDGPAPIWISWRTITGNVNVKAGGQLAMASDLVNGNVNVTGAGSFLMWTNQANHVTGNLVVNASSGVYTGGPGTTSFGNWTQYPGADLPPLPGTGTGPDNPARGQSQVDGRLDFTNNSGGLYSGYPMHVNGKFTYTGNTGPVLDRGGLTWDGKFVTG